MTPGKNIGQNAPAASGDATLMLLSVWLHACVDVLRVIAEQEEDMDKRHQEATLQVSDAASMLGGTLTQQLLLYMCCLTMISNRAQQQARGHAAPRCDSACVVL
jgi:hypothetical protein